MACGNDLGERPLRSRIVQMTSVTSPVDPVMAVRVMLGTLFAFSASQKAISFKSFVQTVAAYELLPHGSARLFALGITVLEVAVCISFLGGFLSQIGASCAVLLLFLFALAMAINLRRGRSWLSCGCFGPGRNSIKWQLVIRNLLLGALASIVGIGSGSWVSQSLRVDLSTFCGFALFICLALVTLLIDLVPSPGL